MGNIVSLGDARWTRVERSVIEESLSEGYDSNSGNYAFIFMALSYHLELD
jgi:hypothetical protein